MPRTTTRSTIELDRKKLLTALQRVGWVVPNHTAKPILQGIHLEASAGLLRLSATDLEVSFSTLVAAEGDLPTCVASFADLTKRIKTAKAETCSLQLERKSGVLVINGGRVEHRIQTMDAKEFPPVPSRSAGTEWRVAGQEFRDALAVALRGVAVESSRYAINGILLEVEQEKARLVTTDGRRLVVIELDQQEGPFEGQAILPCRLATLVGKLIERKSTDIIAAFVQANADEKGEKQPSDLYVAGPDWLISCEEVEGCFPRYREVAPDTHSQFIVDRAGFIDTLNEVAIATDEEHKGMRFDLGVEAIRLTAGFAATGESSGTVPAEFAGGGDGCPTPQARPGQEQEGAVQVRLGLLEGSETPADVRVANRGGAACGRPFPSREIPR